MSTYYWQTVVTENKNENNAIIPINPFILLFIGFNFVVSILIDDQQWEKVAWHRNFFVENQR